MAELKLKPLVVKRENRYARKKYQVLRLQDDCVRNNFVKTMQTKHESLNARISETNVEVQWESVKASVVDAANEVLGSTTKSNKEWLTESFWQLVEQRLQKKGKLLGIQSTRSASELRKEISVLTKKIKNQARTDKRAYYEKLAAEAEIAASKGDLKEVYTITRKLTNNNCQQNVPIKDRNGRVITMEAEQLKVWRDHFERTFNVNAQININSVISPSRLQHRRALRSICTNHPSKEEIFEAVRSQKNGKSAGIDNIPAECLKADANVTAEILYPLFRDIWNSEIIPSDWKEAILVKLPKKGNLSDCNNWRGIALLPAVGKIFNKIILDRIVEPINSKLRKQQAGFRQNRSCIDNINTMRVIIEQCIEYNTTLYMTFVDYEKAFDSVKREYIWEALNRLGIPRKITNLIRNSYNGANCRVLHNGKLSEAFSVTTGVRQGCVLSPLLFIVVVDWIFQIFDSVNRGITWRMNTSLEDLEYADDAVLLSHSHQHMQMKLNLLQQESAKAGLKINIKKTESMRIKANNAALFTIGDETIADVDSFCYLGSTISIDGGAKSDIYNRINKARNAFARLRNIWRSNNIKTCTKVKIFNACVKSVLLYGSETWLVTSATNAKLQAFINRCLRNILKIWWPRVITNEELWRSTHQNSINSEIKKRKYGWIGHTLRKPYEEIPHAALTWNPQGTRRRGRPVMTWQRTIRNETGKSFNELRFMSRNRNVWNTFVESLSS